VSSLPSPAPSPSPARIGGGGDDREPASWTESDFELLGAAVSSLRISASPIGRPSSPSAAAAQLLLPAAECGAAASQFEGPSAEPAGFGAGSAGGLDGSSSGGGGGGGGGGVCDAAEAASVAAEAAVAAAAWALCRPGLGGGGPRQCARALKLLRRYMAAIAEAPAQARVRCICVQNEVYARRLGSGAAGEALMRAVGWRRSGVELLYEGDAEGVWAQRVLAVLEEVGTEMGARAGAMTVGQLSVERGDCQLSGAMERCRQPSRRQGADAGAGEQGVGGQLPPAETGLGDAAASAAVRIKMEPRCSPPSDQSRAPSSKGALSWRGRRPDEADEMASPQPVRVVSVSGWLLGRRA
jgi:hypothetical protein